MGDVIGDMGTVVAANLLGMDSRADAQIIKTTVPAFLKCLVM